MPNLIIEIESESPENPSLYLHTIFSSIKRSALNFDADENVSQFMDELIHLSEFGAGISLKIFKAESERENAEPHPVIKLIAEETDPDILLIAQQISSLIKNKKLPTPVYDHLWDGIYELNNTGNKNEEAKQLEESPEMIAMMIRDYQRGQND